MTPRFSQKSWCLNALIIAVSMLSMPLASAEDETFRVIVTGGKDKPFDHLQLFNQQLRYLVGSPNLSERYIECLNCEDLDKGIAVKDLTYYVLQDRQDHFVFLEAWREVQRKMFSETFTISFDAKPPGGPLCEGYVSPPCAPRPFCVSMGGCSKQASPLPCKKCDPLISEMNKKK